MLQCFTEEHLHHLPCVYGPGFACGEYFLNELKGTIVC